MGVPVRRIIPLTFGAPSLNAANSGIARWVKGSISPLDQKGATGWLADLYGGVQSGDDWARVTIPVSELPLSSFNEAMWSYYMTGTQTMGVNIVIWVHDPNDFDKRAEITQLANVAGLEKAAGWNAHELDATVTQFFFYGENTTGTGLTAGTQYTLNQFKADALFSTWTIYRITLEYGWEASGTFDHVYVADIKLNGQMVFLRPDVPELLGSETKTVTQKTAGTSTTKATMLTPTTGKRIRIISASMVNLSATGAEFEIYFGTGANIDADVTKAIVSAWCDSDYVSSQFHAWPTGTGPLGVANEVVSIRTSADITTYGRVTISYVEE